MSNRSKRIQPNKMMQLRDSLSIKTVLALMLASSLVVFVAWGEVLPQKDTFMPIQKVHVEGVFKHTSAAQLQNVIADFSTGGFFNVDVSRIEEIAKTMDWIRSASVRRVWPDTLHIIVVEHEPLLVWNNSELINRQGELFRPQAQDIPAGLPQLAGPQGSHAMVLSHYRQMSSKLTGLKQNILKLEMDDRHALRVGLDSGLNLMIGRSNIDEALNRFIGVLESPSVNTFTKNKNEIAYVDLRYTNGFAVKWKSGQVSNKQADSGSWRGES